MAKAVFHKNQRVYVKPVGTWAVIEQLKPQWVKGVDEPIRIYYDVGLGREFSAHELTGEAVEADAERRAAGGYDRENWRLMRAKNKWQTPQECANHPFPGTFPIVVTDSQDWGGWRVPGSEYDRDPARIEFQARLIASALRLFHIARQLAETARETPAELPADIRAAAREASDLVSYVENQPVLDDGMGTRAA